LYFCPGKRRILIPDGRELRQYESADGDFHITHCQVIEHMHRQEVYDNRDEPQRDDLTANSGPVAENYDSRKDFITGLDKYFNKLTEVLVLVSNPFVYSEMVVHAGWPDRVLQRRKSLT
jgi:hypothetical protein